jgi:hypothetical protein
MRGEVMKHVHHDVICEWAKGKQIQYEGPPEKWFDCPDNSPGWNTNIRYRVKPEVVRYRNYRKTVWGIPMVCAITEGRKFQSPEQIERMSDFIEWIHTEWQEYEVKS